MMIGTGTPFPLGVKQGQNTHMSLIYARYHVNGNKDYCPFHYRKLLLQIASTAFCCATNTIITLHQGQPCTHYYMLSPMGKRSSCGREPHDFPFAIPFGVTIMHHVGRRMLDCMVGH